LHIDPLNAMLFHDYGLEGVYELGRVTGLPLQTVARVSPGSGISAMQVVTALRQNILVPWHKQQAELPKTGMDLIRSDQGGMVYQPTIGLHQHVAEIDFSSMYPSIMVHHNISPETRRADGSFSEESPPGLIPQTLEPLLKKRLALKQLLATLPKFDPRRKTFSAWSSAHKWLLVTCFGYLGYKNARFGRIEAHEAVTAFGRMALLQAKDAAEDLGYTVLHMYVDGLWIQKPGVSQAEQIQPLLLEITHRTGLPIALDGIFDWIAFLPSRADSRVPVANRFFGVFQNGELKLRGVEARRRDTPPWIVRVQEELINLLATERDPHQLSNKIPEAIGLLRERLSQLRSGQVALDDLVVIHKMSRETDEYLVRSAAVRAASQMDGFAKPPVPGEMVRFLYTQGGEGVLPFDLAQDRPPIINQGRYIDLLLRAAHTVLEPLGIRYEVLFDQVVHRTYQHTLLSAPGLSAGPPLI
jgi:DNA polymerase-2